MSYIPTLVASLDRRLDEIAAEIGTLDDARAALRTRSVAAPPTDSGSNLKRPPRPATQTKRPSRQPRATIIDPPPELAAAVRTGAKPDAVKPSRRASATAPTRRNRSVTALSDEQLERLLGDAGSGLSASTITEQTGVSYSRVLARLRRLEASGTVRRTGTRRSTRWRLITDEDRIAQRAAELERLVAEGPGDRPRRRVRARAS